MHEGRPSATAQRVAERRAAHQLIDRPLVFEDPLALSIIGPEAAFRLRSEPPRQDRFSRALRTFMAVRSRFAEDELARAIERGVCQYVLLGAGLDTFAYRNPDPVTQLRIFEVDHPATQAWKQSRLQQTGIAVPLSLTFVPVDFERQTLAESLPQAGFDPAAPAFCSWLGVVPYLTHEAFSATVRWIGSLPPETGIVFDYSLPRESLSFMQRLAFEAIANRVAAAGEPFRLFFSPDQLAAELRGYGFRRLEDLDSDAINDRYLSHREDGPTLRGGVAHLLSARV